MRKTSVIAAILLLAGCGQQDGTTSGGGAGQRRESPDARNPIRYVKGDWFLGPEVVTPEGRSPSAVSRIAKDRVRVVIDRAGVGHELFDIRCSDSSFRIQRYWSARVDGDPRVARPDAESDGRARRAAEAGCAGRDGPVVHKGNAMRVLHEIRVSRPKTPERLYDGLARPSRQR